MLFLSKTPNTFVDHFNVQTAPNVQVYQVAYMQANNFI